MILSPILAGMPADDIGVFQRLYEEHAGRLRAFLANRLPANDVDDALQEVWLRMLRADWQQVPPAEFRHWALRIANNLVIDMYRKVRPDLIPDIVVQGSDGDDPAQGLLEEERRQRLQRCLEQLEREAAIVVQERLAGRSYEEICDSVGMNTSRAYRLFHQAKAQLQMCIGGAW